MGVHGGVQEEASRAVSRAAGPRYSRQIDGKARRHHDKGRLADGVDADKDSGRHSEYRPDSWNGLVCHRFCRRHSQDSIKDDSRKET